MATKLKLVTPVTHRPFLTIVKALELDNVKIPDKGKSKAANSTGGSRPAPAANDGGIPEFSRNSTLISLAGTMRHRGMTEVAIAAALQAENLARCEPPLDAEEVDGIAASVMRYDAVDPDKLLKSLTDTGNSERFAVRYKDRARFVHGRGWVIWDEMRWRQDATGQIMELAKALARTIHLEATGINDTNIISIMPRKAAIPFAKIAITPITRPSTNITPTTAKVNVTQAVIKAVILCKAAQTLCPIDLKTEY